MSLDKIYGIAGTALNAQLTRMNSQLLTWLTRALLIQRSQRLSGLRGQFSKPFCHMKWQHQAPLMLAELKLTGL